MTDESRHSVRLTIVATDPPGTAGDGILFGLQRGRAVEDPVPACDTTEFRTAIDVVRTGNSDVDFQGDHVHGRRGDRFIYLAWGIPDQTEPFVMFARAKIKLDGIAPDLLDAAIEHDRVLVADLRATDAKGQPASGTIKPPAIEWRTTT
ncbi:DUF5990 family protein [Ilumatobacter nonamiensis]|uniref:DUF5990 family protein n=1 Tax=Ilumatobacter nonamiensis TaxID=467093 RepID=UPI0003497AAF|nr:DUF5990 family protein [Ilumatobacter nonamiensis]